MISMTITGSFALCASRGEMKMTPKIARKDRTLGDTANLVSSLEAAAVSRSWLFVSFVRAISQEHVAQSHGETASEPSRHTVGNERFGEDTLKRANPARASQRREAYLRRSVAVGSR